MKELPLNITNSAKHIKSTPKPGESFSLSKKKKLAKATKDFESLLTSMMLKSMTKSTGGIVGDSGYGGDVLGSIFETKLSNYITKSNGFGIAEKIYEKVTGEALDYNKLMNEIEKDNSINNHKTKSLNSKGVTISEKAKNRINQYQSIVDEASRKYGVDKNLINSVIMAESGGVNNAKSHKNAKGLMQLTDSTANDLGVKNVWNARENIHGGTKYLAQMLRKYDDDIELALAAYNAGPGNVKKHNGVPPFSETKTYIKRVLSYLDNLD